MIRLFAAVVTAFALWPVDEDNQLLAVGDHQLTSAELFAAGYSVASDVGGFCARNAQTCATAGQFAEETAVMIGQVLVAAPTQSTGSAEQAAISEIPNYQ